MHMRKVNKQDVSPKYLALPHVPPEGKFGGGRLTPILVLVATDVTAVFVAVAVMMGAVGGGFFTTVAETTVAIAGGVPAVTPPKSYKCGGGTELSPLPSTTRTTVPCASLTNCATSAGDLPSHCTLLTLTIRIPSTRGALRAKRLSGTISRI